MPLDSRLFALETELEWQDFADCTSDRELRQPVDRQADVEGLTDSEVVI